MAVRETHKRIRPHGLQDAPTFRPTADEFRDPMEYIRKIAPEGRKYGICKIIPPEGWTPGFAIDTEVRALSPVVSNPFLQAQAANNTQETECMLMAPQKFHFRTRRQELNSVEGGMSSFLSSIAQNSPVPLFQHH